MDARAWAANNLAAKLLAEPWTPEAISLVLQSVLGPVHHRTRRALVRSLIAVGDAAYRPSHHELTAYLVGLKYFRPQRNRRFATVLEPPRFAPIAALMDLKHPPLATLGELGDWLGEPPDQLDWLADERRGHGRATDVRLQHYRYAVVAKAGGKVRLLEAPKPRIKAIQRRILHEILSAVPVHACAHGFVAGRSCLTGAQAHAGEAVVATFDLEDFFPSIGQARIHGIFRSLGYPWAVSRRLAGLCTTITPRAVVRRVEDAQGARPRSLALYAVPHLPQGAPTSPALANLLAWRLDLRLHRLAQRVGANYTRYADDLAFSGDEGFARGLGRFGRGVEQILDDEGFALNRAKTRTMARHQRQRVTGIVVNEHCNVGRVEFDALKAILYNCSILGPESQNRSGATDFRRSLEGRISWVEHVTPQRGAKLRRLFEAIDWRASPSS